MLQEYSSLVSAIGQFGVSAEQATEALKSLSNTLKISIGKPLEWLDTKNLYDGEVVLDRDTNTCYVYNKGNFIKISEEAIMKANYENKIEQQPVNGNLNMSLYDLNKAAVGQLPTYSKADEIEAIGRLNAFTQDAVTPHYYMLLGKDLNYYTVFYKHFLQGEENFGEAVIDCLHNVGDIKSIDLTEAGDAIEIWVITPDKEGHVLYLFNYDQGVIVCR